MKRLLTNLKKRGYNASLRIEEEATFIDIFESDDYVQIEFIEGDTLFDTGEKSWSIESRKVGDIAKELEKL